MNILSYILAFAIGVVAIIVGATNADPVAARRFIVFGIWLVLATLWAALWKARGQFGFDIKEKSIFAKLTSNEVVTIPIAIGLVVVFIILAT